MDLRSLVKSSTIIINLYRRVQYSRVRQRAWEGVPEGYRQLNAGCLRACSTLEQWTTYREEIRATIVQCLGDIPPRTAPQVRIVATEQKAGYTLETIRFHNGVDSEVPGYIAIPGKSGPHPAILTLHGHGSSAAYMFGVEQSPQTVAEILVKRGYVVLGINSYFHGARRGTGPAGTRETQERTSDQELSLFKLHLWMGRSLWGMMLREQQMAIDYLVSRPEVDPQRIGAQGMSMGSTAAWWLGALDERIKAAVGVACFTRYEDLIAMRQLSEHGIYFFVPGILKHFDSEGILSLLAPRPFLALTGDSDPGSPVQGIRKLEQILKSVYSLYGAEDNFQSVVYPQTGHVYDDRMKLAMADWFDRHL